MPYNAGGGSPWKSPPSYGDPYVRVISHNGFLYASTNSATHKISLTTQAVVASAPYGGAVLLAGFGSIWVQGGPGILFRLNETDLSGYTPVAVYPENLFAYDSAVLTSDSVLITYAFYKPTKVLRVDASTNVVTELDVPFAGAYRPNDENQTGNVVAVSGGSNMWTAGFNPAGTTLGVNKFDSTGLNFVAHLPIGNLPGQAGYPAHRNAIGYANGKVWSFTEEHELTGPVRTVPAAAFIQSVDPTTNAVGEKFSIPFTTGPYENPTYANLITYGTKSFWGAAGSDDSIWFGVRHSYYQDPYSGTFYPEGYNTSGHQLWRFSTTTNTFTDFWPTGYGYDTNAMPPYGLLTSAIQPLQYPAVGTNRFPFFVGGSGGIWRLYGFPTEPPPPAVGGVFLNTFSVGSSMVG